MPYSKKTKRSEVDQSGTCSEFTITIILTGEHKKIKKGVRIMEYSGQSEGVTTKIALKCMAFAQARLVTSIGTILHLSHTYMAELNVENKSKFQRQAQGQQWANNMSRQK